VALIFTSELFLDQLLFETILIYLCDEIVD